MLNSSLRIALVTGPTLPSADVDLIDRADGGDFGGGAGEEDFVGKVEKLAGNDLLDDRDAEILGHAQDGVAGDAGRAPSCPAAG